MKISTARALGRRVLPGAEGARDADWLLADLLETAPGMLGARDDRPLSLDQVEQFAARLAARRAHQPVAQILGHREFWGRNFCVTRDVLDPRPDTETLIAAALEGPAPRRILDIGTGSGCILLTLLAEWPAAIGTGTDICPKALAVAAKNADRLELASRASFQRTSWCADVAGPFDLIVSNPPYIAADEMAGLAPDVRLWEPHGALTPGGDGTAPYRTIAASLRDCAAPGARLLVEIGHRQAEQVRALFADAGLTEIETYRDFGGLERVISAKYRR